ncbi:MAG: hypothetical protein N3B21_09220 [Clostridia bacterium]|nr:hypothetical protein [Clostridia bacterium]
MKRLLRIYKWIVISVLLQCMILVYVNYFYLERRNEVVATSFEIEEKPDTDAKVKIKQGAQGIKVSFDGAHILYLLEGNLEIVKTQDDKHLKTISGRNGEISYYRWLPDRNMIIYSVKLKQASSGGVQIYTYDVDSGVERSYPEMKGLPTQSSVVDIELSPLTNIVYAKVKVSEEQARVYKFNIMNNLSYVMNVDINTVIKETSYSDNLIYQNTKNKAFIRDGNKSSSKSIPFKNRVALLDVDSEDRVYIGELNSDKKVYCIYYSKIDDKIGENPENTWDKIKLDNAVSPESIAITRRGDVYTYSEDGNTIYNVRTGLESTYEGRLIQILDGYLVVLDGERLKFRAIKGY